MRFRLRTLLIVFAAVPAVVAWLYFQYGPLPFDRHTWLQDYSQRSRMMGDLTASHTLIGKTCDEVITLIGWPDGDTPERWQYASCNRDGSLRWDAIVLTFEGGRVVTVKYVR